MLTGSVGQAGSIRAEAVYSCKNKQKHGNISVGRLIAPPPRPLKYARTRAILADSVQHEAPGSRSGPVPQGAQAWGELPLLLHDLRRGESARHRLG